MDVEKTLSELAASQKSTEAERVLQVYERVMKVYAAATLRYEAAIGAGTAINGFSSSTSHSSDPAQ